MPPGELLTDALLGALTIGAYTMARSAYLRFHHPLTQPVFLGAALVIAVMVSCGVSYAAYQPVQNLLTWPLGTATVALSVPVYRQRARLKASMLPLVCGVAAGSLTTIAAVVCLAALGRIPEDVIGALAVKSVTAPIAVDLARLHGDDPSLTAILVVATGMLGAMLGPLLLHRCRITSPVARGIALGAMSHGQGTAAALLEGEAAGAMASLSMIGAAVFTALVAPLYVPWLLALLVR
jgi:putative effector of murein hydrolase